MDEELTLTADESIYMHVLKQEEYYKWVESLIIKYQHKIMDYKNEIKQYEKNLKKKHNKWKSQIECTISNERITLIKKLIDQYKENL
jgi:hypothetical protein